MAAPHPPTRLAAPGTSTGVKDKRGRLGNAVTMSDRLSCTLRGEPYHRRYEGSSNRNRARIADQQAGLHSVTNSSLGDRPNGMTGPQTTRGPPWNVAASLLTSRSSSNVPEGGLPVTLHGASPARRRAASSTSVLIRSPALRTSPSSGSSVATRPYFLASSSTPSVPRTGMDSTVAHFREARSSRMTSNPGFFRAQLNT